jgi:hypothetical protein
MGGLPFQGASLAVLGANWQGDGGSMRLNQLSGWQQTRRNFSLDVRTGRRPALRPDRQPRWTLMWTWEFMLQSGAVEAMKMTLERC